MKKLIFIGILFLLTGCYKQNVHKDPLLKESERIAVLHKAETDTLTIVIEMDDKIYLVEKDVIKGYTNNETPDPGDAFLIGFIIGVIVVVGFIAAFSRD